MCVMFAIHGAFTTLCLGFPRWYQAGKVVIRGLGREIHGQCRWRWVLYSAQADVLGILATPAIGCVPWPLATMICRPRCNSMPMIWGVSRGIFWISKKICSHSNFSKRCAKAEAAWKGHIPHTPRVWEIKRSFGEPWNEAPPQVEVKIPHPLSEICQYQCWTS